MNRREIAAQRSLMQNVAQASVVAASNAAVITTQIDVAVSGDLISGSPTLSAKFADIEQRLNELQPDQ